MPETLPTPAHDPEELLRLYDHARHQQELASTARYEAEKALQESGLDAWFDGTVENAADIQEYFRHRPYKDAAGNTRIDVPKRGRRLQSADKFFEAKRDVASDMALERSAPHSYEHLPIGQLAIELAVAEHTGDNQTRDHIEAVMKGKAYDTSERERGRDPVSATHRAEVLISVMELKDRKLARLQAGAPPSSPPDDEPTPEEPAPEEPAHQEPPLDEVVYEEPFPEEVVSGEPSPEEPAYEEPPTQETPVYEEPTPEWSESRPEEPRPAGAVAYERSRSQRTRESFRNKRARAAALIGLVLASAALVYGISELGGGTEHEAKPMRPPATKPQAKRPAAPQLPQLKKSPAPAKPPASTARGEYLPKKVMIKAGSGDTIWHEAELQLRRQGRPATPQRIFYLTRHILRINHITWEQARHLGSHGDVSIRLK